MFKSVTYKFDVKISASKYVILNMPNDNIKMCFDDKINTFYKKNAPMFRKPLEKIINKMLEDCRYINGESLERHNFNFGDEPVSLNDIPTDLYDPYFEDNLLKSLKMNKEMGKDSSTIELLWGDIQLGKRVHACIVMWISVFVLKRPVLYIFRNLKIDQSQLSDDIMVTDEFSFNIQYIKKCFDDVSEELGIGKDDYKDFKLPELKPITKKVLDKLSNKESLNPTDLICGLMNHTQLEKINNKCNEYLSYNKELLNITLLVDESDLYAPTASNNNDNPKDVLDSTKCEKLLAKIYQKVKYVLHITGTAHSLLYNITTKLKDNRSIQIPISKVHKMKRKEEYNGLFNDKIKFNTEAVIDWWNGLDEKGKKRKFTIEEDFNINIGRIIGNILDRPQDRYHSFLISEEKIRTNQFQLKDLIITNFSNLFVIVFHGNCLNLYFPKRYENKLVYYSKTDSENCSTDQRLYHKGGIYEKSLDTEKSKVLPNDYGYYQIDSKKFNIKQVYKILAMLFSDEESIVIRTVITITGKYGERGYSFTSDDYKQYPFHLTDQYFPCHIKNKNCTDISQRLRLQGKYSDHPELTLWTSKELKDIITSFYLPFIKKIEKDIMGCQDWEEIKILIEDIIDNGLMKLGKYMKYIDSAKKRKNIQIDKKWDKKGKGYCMFKIDDVDEDWIREWCSRNGLPKYVCVNEIKWDMSKEEFISRYGIYELVLEEDVSNPEIFNSILEYENYCNSKEIPKKNFKPNLNGFIETSITKNKRVYSLDDVKEELSGFSKGSNLGIKSNTKYEDDHKFTRVYACYEDINNKTTFKIVLRVCRVKNSKLTLPKNTLDIKKTPYYLDKNDKLSYTKLKSEWKDKFNDTSCGNGGDGNHFIESVKPPVYYWKTPDGWLYLHDDTKTKDDIVSIKIVNPIDSDNIVVETRKDDEIERFVKECIRDPTNPRLRIGLREIMNFYKKWCKNKGIGPKCSKIMKEELNKFRFRDDKSTRIDLKGKSNKRGYKISFNMEIYNSM
jgi:hypothetical protein